MYTKRKPENKLCFLVPIDLLCGCVQITKFYLSSMEFLIHYELEISKQEISFSKTFLLEFVHGNKGNNPNNFQLWFSCSNVFTFVLLHTKRTKENKRNITGTKDGYLQKFSNN